MALRNADLGQLPPWVESWARCAIEAAEHCGIPVEVTSTLRSCEEQQRLYERYEIGLSRYPVARPGQSAHQYGLAWDSTVPEGLMPTWRAIRVAAGWHVPLGDIVHAEVPGWRSLVTAPLCGAVMT